MQIAPRLFALLLITLLAPGSSARTDDDDATLQHVREGFVAAMAAVTAAPSAPASGDHVRIYTSKDLEKLFAGIPVFIRQRTIIFGAYDNIITRYPKAGRALRAGLQWLENTPLRIFGLSHYWVVEKALSVLNIRLPARENHRYHRAATIAAYTGGKGAHPPLHQPMQHRIPDSKKTRCVQLVILPVKRGYAEIHWGRAATNFRCAGQLNPFSPMT